MFNLLLIIAIFFPPVSAEIPIFGFDPWCPHTCNENSGIMVQVFTEAMKLQNLPIKLESLPWARAIVDARSGRLAGVIGALKEDTPDFIFPTNSIGQQESCFFGLQSSNLSYSGIESLKGKTLGLVKDYKYGDQFDNYVSAPHSRGPSLDFVSGVDTTSKLISKLNASRIDLFIEDKSVTLYQLKKHPTPNLISSKGCLESAPLYVSFSPKDKNKSLQMTKSLDRGIEKLKKNGRWEAIFQKYGASSPIK